jgi:hypothetical protein
LGKVQLHLYKYDDTVSTAQKVLKQNICHLFHEPFSNLSDTFKLLCPNFFLKAGENFQEKEQLSNERRL